MTANTNRTHPLRVAVWAAVSSKPQAAEDKDSLPRQVRDARAWAADRGGDVVRVYEVSGHSRDYIFYQDAAAEMDAYRQLRADCEERAFDVLWCRERSRLGRKDALIAQVEAVVAEAGAEVFSALIPHAVGEAGEVSGIFTSAVERAMAQAENVQRARHHAAGMRARVRRGLPVSLWPVGYRAVRDERGATVGGEFAPEAEAVRLATRMFLDGAGYRNIAKALNASPWRPTRGRTWLPQGVRYLLWNDTYAGYPSCDGTACDEPSDRYPALWDADTHAAVVRERGRRVWGGKPPVSPVSGCVYCARCGYAMSACVSGTHRCFRCATHANQNTSGMSCHTNLVREAVVVRRVEQALAALRAMEPADLDAAMERYAPDRARLDRTRDVAAQTLRDAQERHTRLALAVADGAIDANAARRADARLLEEVAAARAALGNAEQALAALPSAQALREAVADALALPQDLRAAPLEEQRQALLRAGVRVWCEEGQVVRIEVGAV